MPNSEPVPSGSAPALGTAAAKDALPVVRQLGEHVANSNLAARRCFAGLKTLLGDRLGGPGAELSACVDRLDFDGAAAPLATIDAAITQAAREP